MVKNVKSEKVLQARHQGATASKGGCYNYESKVLQPQRGGATNDGK